MPIRTCSAEMAQRRLPELLERAHHGIPTVITKHDKPYAVLQPPGRTTGHRKASPITALKGSGAGLWGSGSTVTLADLRDEWA